MPAETPRWWLLGTFTGYRKLERECECEQARPRVVQLTHSIAGWVVGRKKSKIVLGLAYALGGWPQ